MFNKIKFAAILLFIGLLSVDVYAQVPQGFNFQAIARGADGLPLTSQEISVRISILAGSETGDASYVETHTVTTSSVGLFQIVIGEGTAAESTFDQVDWAGSDHYVQLEVDPAGGDEFESLGATQLLSVPYALLAENVVNGGGSVGDFPLNLNLNTADTDSSFIINIEGSTTAKPFQVFSKSTGFNGAVWGEAISDASNSQNQRGTYGMANGLGTGQHVGLFGGAVNFDATGGNRRGVYGQAASKAKFNQGVVGLAAGDGNGESETDPENGDFGSFNLGGYFQSYGNLNGNVGAEGVTTGETGSLRNFGLIGTARTFADGRNIGMRAEAFGSSTENTGAEAVASGETKNVGLRAEARNGTSNIAIFAEADTAAILNGDVVINGSLIHNGGSVGGGSANGSTLDSLFFATAPEASYQRNSSFYPGYQRYSDQDGNFSVLSRNQLQFGNDGDAGAVYNWFKKGGMQVASDNYTNGEQASGINPGRLYMDISENGEFYVPLEFGIGNASEGGRAWFTMNSLERKKADKAGAINFNVVNNAEGSDPTGESGELFLNGDDTPNFQIGGQNWNNNDLPFFAMYGSTPDGSGWYRNNFNMSVGSDGTNEWADISIVKTDIAGESVVSETVLINGNNGEINTVGALKAATLEIAGDLASDQFNRITGGGISGGQDSYTDGFVLNHEASGGPLLEMFVGGTKTVDINGSSGSITVTSLTETSDRRLKTNIQPLQNALDNTLKLRGVSYNWADVNKTQDNQIGVIAQEVEKLYPEFVHTDEEGMKSVNYSQMVAVLIEAVKELNTKIENLEAENNILQAKVDEIDEMKAQLNQIMSLISTQLPAQSQEVPADK